MNEDVSSIIRKRHRTRLQVLALLLEAKKNNWTKIRELEKLYIEKFSQKLENWYIWILHRDKIVEFKYLKFEDWEKSGTINLIKNPKLQEYKLDYIRIVPSKYEEIESLKNFIATKI